MLQREEARNINDLRQEALIAELTSAIGSRILVIIESYPFFYVGRILEVEADTISIQVEICNVPEFDNTSLRTHIDNIQVYFVETPENPIPEIRV
ncbi:hypothetical protein ASD24_03690 [Paenibacillus sp. Root52]|uniref:hypothetical protein n=1 Tax=Paenibacillus sp. Root52 TaxID=1736552 RepID=UPI0006FD2ECC|nr:hypothetical protein [Paenibacillus sp. Root52]KQY94659.1 hypothetical protein ASD24_03690 [Paenibacillus sp. Root52]